MTTAPTPDKPHPTLTRKPTPFVRVPPLAPGESGYAVSSDARPRDSFAPRAPQPRSRTAPRRALRRATTSGSTKSAHATPPPDTNADTNADADTDADADLDTASIRAIPSTSTSFALATPPAALSSTGMLDYNANCAPQLEGVRLGLEPLSRAVAALPPGTVTPDRSVRVADFGSSHGRNSSAAVKLVVGLVADRVASVEVVHQDLPSNDFNALFRCVASSESPHAYTTSRSNVFAMATAGSFYRRVFPDDSVTLGFSSTAVHWLSEPSPLRGYLSHVLVPGADAARDPDTARQLERLADIAKRDWHAYVAHRERELVPGGQLVHVDIRRDVSPAGDSDWGPIQPVFALAQTLLREHFGAGEVMTQPVYVRSKAEFLEPFATGASKLVVRECHELEIPDALEGTLARDGAAAYADRVVGFWRAAAAPSLRLEERFSRDRVEGFYAAFQDAVRRDPAEYRVAWKVLVTRWEKPVGA